MMKRIYQCFYRSAWYGPTLVVISLLIFSAIFLLLYCLSKEVDGDSAVYSFLSLGGVATLIVFFWGQVLIPHLKNRRSEKDFLSYIKANAELTLEEFSPNSTPITVSVFKEHLEKHGLLTPNWLTHFTKETPDQQHIPELIAMFYLGIQRAKSQEAVDQGYYPVPSYSGAMSSEAFDHSHPVWSLSKSVSKDVHGFLVTQKDVVDAIGAMLSGKAKELVESKDIADRLRWCQFVDGILESLIKHYLASEKVINVLREMDCEIAVTNTDGDKSDDQKRKMFLEWLHTLELLYDCGDLGDVKRDIDKCLENPSIIPKLLKSIKKAICLYRSSTKEDFSECYSEKDGSDLTNEQRKALEYQPKSYVKLYLDVMLLQIADLEQQL